MAQIAAFYDHIQDAARQENASVEEILQEAAGMGIRLLEVSDRNLKDRIPEVGRELSLAGMGISAIPAYFDFGRDADVKKQALPILEAAKELAADRLLVIPGFFKPEDGPEDRERQVESMIECINRLADLSAGFGVSLVMEDYDDPAAPFSRIAGVRRFLDGCPGLDSCFDTGNFRPAAEDELDAYEALKDRIAHVHLKDRAYTGGKDLWSLTAADGQALYPAPVGGGDLKLEEIVSRLRRDGYDGIYSIEHYGAPAMLEYLRKSAAWVHAHVE